MRTSIIGWSVSVLVFASGCQMDSDKGQASVAEGTRPASMLGMDGEEEVPLDQVPALVKNAALKAFPSLELESAEAEVEDGVLLYSLSGTDDEGALEVEVTTDGTILEVERGEDDEDDDDDGEDGDDEEQPIALDQVPAHVLQAALKAVPGLIVEQAEMEVEEGVTVYDLEGTAAGEPVEVEVSAEGEVLEIEHGEEED